MMEFKSRAIRSLLELHDAELRAFLATWRRYARAGVPMPEAHGDEDYETIDRLGTHVLKAARSFLARITEWLGRPAVDLDMAEDVQDLTARADEFAESLLEAYKRHLSSATDEEIGAWVHKTRQGNAISIEMLLEHALVHPMRHRVQLERILANTS
jgi:uncharacterized damage-inducible protein DinB